MALVVRSRGILAGVVAAPVISHLVGFGMEAITLDVTTEQFDEALGVTPASRDLSRSSSQRSTSAWRSTRTTMSATAAVYCSQRSRSARSSCRRWYWRCSGRATPNA